MKTIMFDFDGTMVNSKAVMIEAFNDLAKKNDYNQIEYSQIKNLSSMSINDRCKMLKIPRHKLPIVVYELKKKYSKYLLEIDVVDGMLYILNKLKEEGYTLGILSSNSKNTIRIFLNNRKINVFDYIFSSTGLFAKHLTIKHVLKYYKIKKEDLVYVGDEIRDIVACKRCGVKIITVSWGYDDKSLLEKEKPDFLINNPKDIVDIVRLKI
jgi:phosphoglycolate phosphatase